MSASLAYLLTWTTYGSWLPGDERGWVRRGGDSIELGSCQLRARAQQDLVCGPVGLDPQQQDLVRKTIVGHCAYRGWSLHAVNVRSNHVHVVVTSDCSPEQTMQQLKAWCSRRLTEDVRRTSGNDKPGARATGSSLREATTARRKWWTQRGSTKWINDEAYLHNAIRYVNEGQYYAAHL